MAAPTFTPTWLDPADVRDWLRDKGIPPASTDAELDRICAQTEAHAQRHRPEWWNAEDPPAYVPDGETYQGAVMYAAKVCRRRNSPAGVETFGDAGIVFTPKFDAEVDRALHTGGFLHPAVG